MSEETGSTEPTTPEAQPPPVEVAPAQAPAETDWKAEAKKWESRAKENKTAAERLAELEEASKTEAEKVADRAAKAEQRASEAEARLLRLSVASEKAIPTDLHQFLTASDEEGLRSQADLLLSRIAPPPTPPPPPFNGGPRGEAASASQLTQADLNQMTPGQIVKAQADGRLNDLLGIR